MPLLYLKILNQWEYQVAHYSNIKHNAATHTTDTFLLSHTHTQIRHCFRNSSNLYTLHRVSRVFVGKKYKQTMKVIKPKTKTKRVRENTKTNLRREALACAGGWRTLAVLLLLLVNNEGAAGCGEGCRNNKCWKCENHREFSGRSWGGLWPALKMFLTQHVVK